MSQDNQHAAPEEVAGGYGTPTVEQETGADAKQFAQPREEGDSGGAGFDQGSGAAPIPRDPGAPPGAEDVAVPSADAEIDEGNADEPGSGQFSSEPGQDAAGEPDGSGNDLPKEKSPNDDDETFDAG